MQAANLTRKITPVYPAEAKAKGIQGVVRLGVRIDRDGGETVAVQTDPNQRFPVEILTEVNVNFTLFQ